MNDFNSGNNQQKAQKLANACNQAGITKEQLQQLYGLMKK